MWAYVVVFESAQVASSSTLNVRLLLAVWLPISVGSVFALDVIVTSPFTVMVRAEPLDLIAHEDDSPSYVY